MRTLLKRIGTALLFAVIAICLAPTLIPPFLDRIYHEGPPSDHFDGQRFFNLGVSGPEPAAHASGRRGFLIRFISGDRAQWPERVEVTQTVPPPRVDGSEMLVTWIGHATVLVQTGGLNILTDPIWSERASPFSFIGPKRVRAPGVAFQKLPKIDLVLISHNHYDHMDLPTLKRLWERDRPVIVTSLGNDTILSQVGIPPQGLHSRSGVVALDWGQDALVEGATMDDWTADPKGGVPMAMVSVVRNHHWSSRWGTDRNRALWSAFSVLTPSGSIFFAGDTGWGDGSWVREATRGGPYRLAVIPIGAYEPRDFMKTNHINPEEAVRIFEALKPRQALGIHWGTFQLTFEPIDDPPQRLERLKRERGIARDRFVATEVGQSFQVSPL
jgi:L-ascorbate metabolism protein UlaG (beta-lactamase superfamily)